MAKCQVENCSNDVSKAGYKLCYEHWKAEKDGVITACEECGKYKDNDYPLCLDCHNKKKGKDSPKPFKGKTLSSSAIGKEFDLSAMKINQILAELGWIAKYTKGWIPTPNGQSHGAQSKEMRESGVPYVVWPEDMLDNKTFRRSIGTFLGEPLDDGEDDDFLSDEEPGSKKEENKQGFREKFPCDYRTMDGHKVRSKAEMAIDNFLYVNGVVHAFERRLPIEEDVYCDFYLPKNKVYIEYWGLENDTKYEARKNEKLKIYKKHNFSLIELTDEHVRNLDDHLPRMLLKFGIDTNA